MTLCDTFDADSLRPCDRICAVFLASGPKKHPAPRDRKRGQGTPCREGDTDILAPVSRRGHDVRPAFAVSRGYLRLGLLPSFRKARRDGRPPGKGGNAQPRH